MLQRSRSHPTVLLSGLALLACISSAQILAAHPTTSRHRHLRQQRVGSARATEPHIDGDAHLESAFHHGGVLCDPADRLSVNGKTNSRCSDQTPVAACVPRYSHQFDVAPLPLPAVCTFSKSIARSPSPGRSPPVA